MEPSGRKRGPGEPHCALPRAANPLQGAATCFRFSRADEARSPGGAGLGLAIVEVIARAYGGSAAVANRKGEDTGADTWITLPRAERPRTGIS